MFVSLFALCCFTLVKKGLETCTNEKKIQSEEDSKKIGNLTSDLNILKSDKEILSRAYNDKSDEEKKCNVKLSQTTAEKINFENKYKMNNIDTFFSFVQVSKSVFTFVKFVFNSSKVWSNKLALFKFELLTSLFNFINVSIMVEPDSTEGAMDLKFIFTKSIAPFNSFFNEVESVSDMM